MLSPPSAKQFDQTKTAFSYLLKPKNAAAVSVKSFCAQELSQITETKIEQV